jgi:hypothetical protein
VIDLWNEMMELLQWNYSPPVLLQHVIHLIAMTGSVVFRVDDHVAIVAGWHAGGLDIDLNRPHESLAAMKNLYSHRFKCSGTTTTEELNLGSTQMQIHPFLIRLHIIHLTVSLSAASIAKKSCFPLATEGTVPSISALSRLRRR